MIWNSFSEFVHMGGYALYVWGSYGVALLLMTLEPWAAVRRRRQAQQAARVAAEPLP